MLVMMAATSEIATPTTLIVSPGDRIRELPVGAMSERNQKVLGLHRCCVRGVREARWAFWYIGFFLGWAATDELGEYSSASTEKAEKRREGEEKAGDRGKVLLLSALGYAAGHRHPPSLPCHEALL